MKAHCLLVFWHKNSQIYSEELHFCTKELNSHLLWILQMDKTSTEELLRVSYCTYFHSIIHYSVIFWGNFLYTINVFYLKKRMFRITGIGNRNLCKQTFTTLKNLPPSSFVVDTWTNIILHLITITETPGRYLT
jgi:hypothetical protein